MQIINEHSEIESESSLMNINLKRKANTSSKAENLYKESNNIHQRNKTDQLHMYKNDDIHNFHIDKSIIEDPKSMLKMKNKDDFIPHTSKLKISNFFNQITVNNKSCKNNIFNQNNIITQL